MQVFRENIVCSGNLLVVKEESFEYNDFPFHSHSEYEIILILESSGQRFVGHSITDFAAVDLCMFGSNNDRGVSQVSSEAGFNNVPYFNRKFKAVKGMTPMEYQNILRSAEWWSRKKKKVSLC